ncbi:MAG: response regulator [Holophagaceae bacterium]|nr:response regulator [Holophagaceae bacterium]
MDKERKTIFIVDDDQTILAVGANVLGEYYDVLTLNSGTKLMKTLENNIPDLILLDIEMPEMNGLDVIKLLKRNPETAQIPVIFLTGKKDTDLEPEAMSYGAVDYINKPPSVPRLLKRIENQLLLESQKRKLVAQNNEQTTAVCRNLSEGETADESLKETRKTIFMVDDDPTILAVGVNVLGEHYDVLTLNSGAKLLKAIEKNIPDLILLDIEMPEMNGLDVIKLLKCNAKTAEIPVIFLTGSKDADIQLEGMSFGAADYLNKPLSPPSLLKRIEMQMLIESQKQKLFHQKNELANRFAGTNWSHN